MQNSKPTSMDPKWYVPLSQSKELILDHPIEIDAYHTDAKTGKKYGFNKASAKPSFSEMEHLEELTDKNVTKYFGREHLPPGLQKKYSHLYGETKNAPKTPEQKKAETPTKAKPPVSETKVDKTTEKIRNKTETANTKTTVPPPTPPKSDPKPSSQPKVKTSVPDTKKASKFLGKNRGKIALGAIGLGIVSSWIDGEDDDVLSSTGKGIKSGVTLSAAAYGAEHLLKTQTVQDLVKGEVSDISKSVRNKANAERRMLTVHGKLGTASKYGLAAVGIATVLDVASRAKEGVDAKMITQQQEQSNVDRKKKQKQKQKKDAYGSIRDGEIVFDLFEARSGHHKMGNAKFN